MLWLKYGNTSNNSDDQFCNVCCSVYPFVFVGHDVGSRQIKFFAFWQLDLQDKEMSPIKSKQHTGHWICDHIVHSGKMKQQGLLLLDSKKCF